MRMGGVANATVKSFEERSLYAECTRVVAPTHTTKCARPLDREAVSPLKCQEGKEGIQHVCVALLRYGLHEQVHSQTHLCIVWQSCVRCFSSPAKQSPR